MNHILFSRFELNIQGLAEKSIARLQWHQWATKAVALSVAFVFKASRNSDFHELILDGFKLLDLFDRALHRLIHAFELFSIDRLHLELFRLGRHPTQTSGQLRTVLDCNSQTQQVQQKTHDHQKDSQSERSTNDRGTRDGNCLYASGRSGQPHELHSCRLAQ